MLLLSPTRSSTLSISADIGDSIGERSPFGASSSATAASPLVAAHKSSVAAAAAAAAQFEVKEVIWDLIAAVRGELQEAIAQARALWRELEMQVGQQWQAPLAESQERCRAAEEAIDQASWELEEIEDSARELAAARSDLAQQLLERQMVAEGPLFLSDVKRESTRLTRHIHDLDAEANKLAAQSQELQREREELELQAKRLHLDQQEASEKILEQSAARAHVWERVASLVSLRGTPPEQGTPLESLVARLGGDWAEAQRLELQRQAESDDLLARREDLLHRLALAKEAEGAAISELAVAEDEYAERQREWRRQEQDAKEELASAKAEHRVMGQVISEMQKVRPQLLGLIQDLREGNRAGREAQQVLADELASLRAVVGRRRRADGGGGSPKALRASDLNDSAEIEAEAAAEQDELCRAAEENDRLHKQLLELQDDNAHLIEEQEGLIQHVKGKVEFMKRQRQFGA